MDSIGFKLALTAVFVVLNGFFVAAEFALVKVRGSRVQSLADAGSKSAVVVGHLLANMNLYLSACQLGITLASLILGWLAEPAVAAGLKVGLTSLGVSLPANVLHIVSLAVALTIVTLLHMVLGEQVPKIWAIQRAERASLLIAYPLRIFAAMFRPLIWIINSLSNGLLRLIGVNPEASHEGVHDASEIRSILAHSADAGKISTRQREFAHNILAIAVLEVRHVLIPRADIVWLSKDASREETLQTIRESGHSRLPLCDPDLDKVVGVLHTKSLLASSEDSEFDLTALARKPLFVPDRLPLSRLIVELQHSRAGCAVVVEERGTVLGLVFLEDALEEIVGPIYDEFDDPDPGSAHQVKRLSDKAVEISGAMSLPEAQKLLNLEHPSEADTIGGFVIAQLKALPDSGDQLLVGPYRVTVLSVSGQRIRRIRFEPATDPSPADAADPSDAEEEKKP